MVAVGAAVSAAQAAHGAGPGRRQNGVQGVMMFRRNRGATIAWRKRRKCLSAGRCTALHWQSAQPIGLACTEDREGMCVQGTCMCWRALVQPCPVHGYPVRGGVSQAHRAVDRLDTRTYAVQDEGVSVCKGSACTGAPRHSPGCGHPARGCEGQAQRDVG